MNLIRPPMASQMPLEGRWRRAPMQSPQPSPANPSQASCGSLACDLGRDRSYSSGSALSVAGNVGLARFDGHPPSGALARGGCPSWRPWNPSNLARVGRSPPEFKAEIVELCQRGDRWIGRVARDFDLTETAVREWVRQAERDAVRVATAG